MPRLWGVRIPFYDPLLGLAQPRGGWAVLGQEGTWASKCRPLATPVLTLSILG